jgi:3-hydroxyisobutyrate dehydrogenase
MACWLRNSRLVRLRLSVRRFRMTGCSSSRGSRLSEACGTSIRLLPGCLIAARPLLDPLCQRIFHWGPVGTGTVYKLIINMIGAVQIASVAEGMALAERAGLSLSQVADAIATGQAAAPQVVRTARRIADNHHDTEVVFTPQLRLKDVQYALRLAKQLGLQAPFGEVAGDGLRDLCDRPGPQPNESKIIEVARSRRVNAS